MKSLKVKLLIALVALSAASSADATLVSSYSFSGNANDGVGNNNGMVTGATLTSDRFGSSNSAYYFDGIDDRISIRDSASLNIAGDMTISAWVNMQDSYPYQRYIFANMQEVSPHYGYSFGVWDNKLRFMAGDQSVFGNIAVNGQDWVHVVATLSGNTATLYVNGVYDNSGQVGVPVFSPYSPDAQVIGSSSPGSYYYWKGAIDDIGIYDHALSLGEVQALETQPVPEPTTCLLFGGGVLALGFWRKRKENKMVSEIEE